MLVLTGAGCSTASGIPDYRDEKRQLKRAPYMDFRDFTRSAANRQRYWGRSMLGWQRVSNASPNAAHWALADLERAGISAHLITQNVDRLHQRAGSRQVLDLHGRLDRVRCLECDGTLSRENLQAELIASNPTFATLSAPGAPDGDAELTGVDFDELRIPVCKHCGGTLKPDVVFIGESVPRQRVQEAMEALHRASALLIVGSSLTVFSGYRFALRARELGKPVAALNIGRTRADSLLSLKISAACADILPAALKRLAG